LYPYQHHPKWQDGGGFLETHMITMLEAQAAGCVPITRLKWRYPRDKSSWY